MGIYSKRDGIHTAREKNYGENYEKVRRICLNAARVIQDRQNAKPLSKCRVAAVVDRHNRVRAITVEANTKPIPDLDALEKVVRDGGGRTEYLNCNLDNIGRRAGRQ